jgi:hypothetical protein
VIFLAVKFSVLNFSTHKSTPFKNYFKGVVLALSSSGQYTGDTRITPPPTSDKRMGNLFCCCYFLPDGTNQQSLPKSFLPSTVSVPSLPSLLCCFQRKCSFFPKTLLNAKGCFCVWDSATLCCFRKKEVVQDQLHMLNQIQV